MAFGKKGKKALSAGCIVIGEDRNITRRRLDATGVFFLDHDNLLAYDSLPEAIGACTQHKGGRKRDLGYTSILYEPMSRPFSFKTLNWAGTEHKADIILASSRSEGSSKSIQAMEKSDRFDKMSTILLLLSAGVIGMAILFALQSGILSKIFGG